MIGDSKKLGESLRKVRIENNFTQKNIADVLGIDRTTYTYYETGSSNPSPKTLIALSQIYNVSVGYLMGIEEDRTVVRKTVPDPVVASDPISMLKEKEKELLMYFRVLEDEQKKEVIELLKKLLKESKEK